MRRTRQRASLTNLCRQRLKFDGGVWKLHVSLALDEDAKSRPANGQGDQNGLEDPKDRRSAGRHGNQHVCLRGAEVARNALSNSQ